MSGDERPMTDLRALAEKATPGPWHYGHPVEDGCVRLVPYTGEGGGTEPPGYWAADTKELTGEIHTPAIGHLLQAVWHNDSSAGLYGREEDAAYIAAASPDRILALLDANDTLTARLAAVEGALANLATTFASESIPHRTPTQEYRRSVVRRTDALRAVLTDPATPLDRETT